MYVWYVLCGMYAVCKGLLLSSLWVQDGLLPLHGVLEQKHLECVKLLLQHGASPQKTTVQVRLMRNVP